jgi:hypothetical protein
LFAKWYFIGSEADDALAIDRRYLAERKVAAFAAAVIRRIPCRLSLHLLG